jgi:hypothetical protein
MPDAKLLIPDDAMPRLRQMPTRRTACPAHPDDRYLHTFPFAVFLFLSCADGANHTLDRCYLRRYSTGLRFVIRSWHHREIRGVVRTFGEGTDNAANLAKQNGLARLAGFDNSTAGNNDPTCGWRRPRRTKNKTK